MSTPQDKVYPLIFPPGIQRDGTAFAAKTYVDGQWVRFWADGSGVPKPRKMGGYSELLGVTNIGRGAFVLPNPPNFDVYVGDFQSLYYVQMDPSGDALSGTIARTPTGFIADPNNVWQFDTMYSNALGTNVIIAFSAPNLSSIASTTERPVYYGAEFPAVINQPLIPTGFSVSGGIVTLTPFLFMFGNNGRIIVSAENDPTTTLLDATVTTSKVVFGLPVRGGNSSPAGLLWSLDSLIRVTFVGGDALFAFDTITAESSVLSSQSIIEYDNKYYWAAADRFLFYNGVVQELPNDKNLNYFFSNLNYAQRQKVWATKYTKAGEIWWHYPSGNSVECDKAIIYNVRYNCWYDTSIGRSSGSFDSTFASPVWTGNVLDANHDYPIWVHEQGVDQVLIDGTVTAIDSFIETASMAYCGEGPGKNMMGLDRWIYLWRVEPDFVQSQNLTMTVKTQEYAQGPVSTSAQNPYTLTPTMIKQDLREQGREMRIKFESNVIGGDYWMGHVLVVMRIGDGRQSTATR